MASKGRSIALDFLRSLVDYKADTCVTWPFCRDPNNGYGRVGRDRKIRWAHRVMCEFAHGVPPTPSHEASHTCGNGPAGCVNPRHLKWKTASENQMDRRRHGTHVTSRWGSRGKLRPEEKDRIRELRGQHTIFELGKMYDVPFQTISRIQHEDPDRPRKIKPFWPEDDAFILEQLAAGASLAEVAKLMGRTYGSITGRVARIRRKAA